MRPIIILLLSLCVLPLVESSSSPNQHVFPPVLASYSPLVLTASATPTAGILPLNVTFTGSASGGTSPYAMIWDFGDGKTVTGYTIVSHVYKFPGNFTAQFNVADSSVPSYLGQKSVSVEVHQVGGFLVTVVDKTNSPVAKATVRLVSGPSGQQLLTLTATSLGVANFSGIASGFYGLQAAASGYNTNTTTVFAKPGSPANYTIVLSPPPALPGAPFPTLPLILAFAGVFIALAVLRWFLRSRKSYRANPEKSRDTSPRQPPPPRKLRGTR
jgi:PKD repeat protein